jgi:predicted nucleic acid-binding protein
VKAIAEALLDSNVVIAMLVEAHEHHAASIRLMDHGGKRFAIAAHSYAEAYVTLTRRSAHAPFRWSAEQAMAALESVAAASTLVGLSPAQTFDTLRGYGEEGGIGPRLYDRLIGQVAVHYAIPRIITWNVGQMRDLFPKLTVLDPAEALGG